ncbi:hypothetical protein MBUL_03189 [Methylobacterium bullatum]|uniref:Serine protease n=1 Tax=Methylobacterium bullatum TaxID=570505 RepID=A0A679JA23_9HYPH|nr:hypothetical protein MBUL_03189 [Methylobacterium bullatum]
MPDGGALLTHDDPRIAALVAEITGDWPHVIAVWDAFRAKHEILLRGDLQVDRLSFLKQAVWAAIGGGVLRALLSRLTEENLTAAGLNAASTPFLGASFALQSYVNGAWKPQNALIGGRRLMEACDHTCRITIDGQHRGTGVLIRPTVVATAAHVVSTLVGQSGQRLPGSLARIGITFFDADDLLPDGETQEARPIAARLHEEWLAHYSPRAHGEGEALYAIDSVAGIAAPTGPWDLALIRLTTPPRAGLRGHRVCSGSPPKATFGVHILHHPGDALGAPMGLVWSIGDINRDLGAPLPLRWLHDANTDGGSSGAPCFDDNWRVVALHQAGPNLIAAANQNNRAVPIYSWAEQVETLARLADQTPYLVHAPDERRDPTPVFGRRDLQFRCWRAMSPGLPPRQRLFVVLGDVPTDRTFTVAIVEELARLAGCRLMGLDVRNLKLRSPLEFVQAIFGGLGATLPETLNAPSRLTTELRDLRNDILPWLIREVEAIADKRPLWLALDGLEVCDTAANGAAQVVEALIGALNDAPHLNLLLIGWTGPAQAEHVEILPNVPDIDDVVDHLLLALAPPGFRPPHEVRATFHVLVASNLAAQPPGPAYLRAAAAANGATETLRAVINAFTPKLAPVAGGAGE